MLDCGASPPVWGGVAARRVTAFALPQSMKALSPGLRRLLPGLAFVGLTLVKNALAPMLRTESGNQNKQAFDRIDRVISDYISSTDRAR